MKGFGGNRVLGLAVGERSALACELSRATAAGGAGGFRAERMAEFVYPAGLAPDDAATFGPALHDFLKAQHFSSKRAVIGLPLKWAVVKTKEVPPASPATLANLLRLQAERDFAMEPQDLALEYVGTSNPSAAGTVLLLAVPRKRVDGVAAAAGEAGLTVEAVTLSAVALGDQTGRQTGGEGAVLHVSSGAAELAVQHRGQPRVLRHLRAPVTVAIGGTGAATTAGVAGPAGGENTEGAIPRETTVAPGAAALTVELRQVLSLMPQNGTAGQLNVWDGVGLGDAPARWADALGVPVREQSLSSLGVSPTANAAEAAAPGGRFAPAVALALAGLGADHVVPNLLRSRLAPPKPSRVGKPLVWGVVLGVTAVIAIVAAVLGLSNDRAEIAQMKAQLAKMQPDIKTAEASIARTSFAQRWSDHEPRFLTVLRDLTDVFPAEGQVWASSVNVQDDGRVTITGRGSNSTAVQRALDRLRASKFTDLKVLDMRPAGRSTDVTFSASFRFAPPGAAATQPSSTARTGVAANPATQRIERGTRR